MSAITSLYVGNNPIPSWIDFEENEVKLSEGNYFVPLFWFAMFDLSNIKHYEDPDGESENPDENMVPYFSGGKSECLENFKKRKKFLKLFLPSSENTFEKWENIIEQASENFVTVDLSEVFYMDENVMSEIQDVINGFESPSADMISSIVEICGANYNVERRELEAKEGYPTDYHIVGLLSNG